MAKCVTEKFSKDEQMSIRTVRDLHDNFKGRINIRTAFYNRAHMTAHSMSWKTRTTMEQHGKHFAASVKMWGKNVLRQQKPTRTTLDDIATIGKARVSFRERKMTIKREVSCSDNILRARELHEENSIAQKLQEQACEHL